jgi:16S rRNA (uracil1498-N3)-methyltransferase
LVLFFKKELLSSFMIPRVYLSAVLAEEASVAGTASQAHYLRNVLRRNDNDEVRLFNGTDGEFAARITVLRKNAVSFLPTHQTRPQQAEPETCLVFCLLKRDTTDLVIQKATELGVAAIFPVTSDRTNATAPRLDRLHAIAVEAAEQSERLTIPVIHPPQPLRALLAAWPANRPLAAAIEREAAPPPARQTALLIGPEGGFSPGELDVLHAATFIQPVSLGPRILRAETAAIAGLALLLAHSS